MLFEIIKDTATDIILKNDGILKIIERRWKRSKEFKFEVKFHFSPSYWMIPGVVYNGNTHGKSKVPRVSLESGWFFREDRCSLPSAAIVENSEYVLAVFIEPAKSEKELSCVGIKGNRIIIRIPWMEIPRTYSGKQHFSRPIVTYFKQPIEYTRKFYVIFANYRKLNYKRGYYLVLEKAWEIFGQKVKISQILLHKYIKLKTEFGIRWHYFEFGNISSFLQSLVPHTPICGGIISASFACKAMEMALALYRLYLITRNKVLQKIAFKVANFHCRGLRENRIFLSDYHIFTRKWINCFRPKYANTRQIGEAIYALLRLYKLAKIYEEENELWLATAKNVADFL